MTLGMLRDVVVDFQLMIRAESKTIKNLEVGVRCTQRTLKIVLINEILFAISIFVFHVPHKLLFNASSCNIYAVCALIKQKFDCAWGRSDYYIMP